MTEDHVTGAHNVTGSQGPMRSGVAGGRTIPMPVTGIDWAASYDAVDTHCAGLTERIITAGLDTVPGDTMEERRRWFATHLDGVRTLLMCEPRGNAWMSGAILQPPTREDADAGLLFIEVTGVLPLCDAATMAAATVLVATGRVPAVEPVTHVRLDTPADLVTADVHVHNGRTGAVTMGGVPSFLVDRDLAVDVPGVGTVHCDVAYGGNFYAFVDLERLGIPFAVDSHTRLESLGTVIMTAVNEQARPVHPVSGYAGCEHVVFLAPGSDARHTRHALINDPGWLDRSPGGTGTSARLAQLYARGRLGLGDELVNESLIGTSFLGRIRQTTDVAGLPAVVPEITGNCWITGVGRYLLDPTDPFPAGFTV